MSTVEEVTMLLAYAAAVDPRFNTSDREQAQARAVAWCDALDVVPGDFSLNYVRRYYRGHHEWPVTPGMIRTSYLAQLRRSEHAERSRELASQPRTATEDRPPSIVAALEQARAACVDASRRWGVS